MIFIMKDSIKFELILKESQFLKKFKVYLKLGITNIYFYKMMLLKSIKNLKEKM